MTQGVLGTAALIALTFGVHFATGSYQVAGISNWSAMIVPVAELVLVAFVEELVIRGVLFRIVETSLGTWIALGLTSTLFALSHLPNEGVTILAVAVTAMAGVRLCVAFMVTDRLWLALGIHFAWNCMFGTFSRGL